MQLSVEERIDVLLEIAADADRQARKLSTRISWIPHGYDKTEMFVLRDTLETIHVKAMRSAELLTLRAVTLKDLQL